MLELCFADRLAQMRLRCAHLAVESYGTVGE